jgi:hypothetical protein
MVFQPGMHLDTAPDSRPAGHRMDITDVSEVDAAVLEDAYRRAG